MVAGVVSDPKVQASIFDLPDDSQFDQSQGLVNVFSEMLEKALFLTKHLLMNAIWWRLNNMGLIKHSHKNL